MHRLDLVLYSHPKEFWGNGVRTNSKRIPPLYGKLRGGSNPRRYTTQDSELNTLLTELFRPHNVGHNVQRVGLAVLRDAALRVRLFSEPFG